MSHANDLRTLPDELRLDSQNPWPGLTAFTEKQHDFFYGRSLESHDLFACVKRERLTVLFGKSGLGKTSLLQAGLFPQLRDAGYLPVYVRLSYEDAAAPFDIQLGMALGAAIESANFAEVALPTQGESVWEYLHRRGGNLINDAGNVVMPVLIFDQFEECFTLGARKDFSSRLVNEYLPGLGDMIENRIPAALTKKLTEDRDLAKRYDLEAHGCRILITLREDYLANLEALRDSMPSLVYIDNRMRLTEMTGEQALSVVIDPSPNLVDPDVAESIVRFVAGAHTDSADGDVRTVDALPLKNLEVAPAILSLFCSQLNEERLKTPGMAKITRALVLSQGVTIIEDFYKKCIAGMHPAVRRLIEDRLLTSAGYRDNIDLAEARATLERAGAKPSYIDDLVKLRLLQIEDHRGVPRLELTHDVLAEPVKHSRDDWKKEQQREAAQQQERDALIRAKDAEHEALKRTRFLQKMVGAAAAVCLLLAGVVVYALIQRNKAQQLQKVAQQELENEKKSEIAQVGLRRQAQEETANAHQKELEVNRSDDALKLSINQINAQKIALAASVDKSLSMQKKLTGMDSEILDHCVSMYSKFDDTADSEKDDVGKDGVRILYENLLLASGQCLSLAEEANRFDPSDIDVTDNLSMIPVRAAASASKRTINPQASREQVHKDFDLEQKLPMFQPGVQDDVAKIELARAYLAFAYIFSSIQDDLAQPTAQKALAMLDDIRKHANRNTWNFHHWDILAGADNWHAIYLLYAEKNPDAIAAYADAVDDAKKAYELAPIKGGFENQYLYFLMRLGDTQKEFGKDDNDAAIETYQKALPIAIQLSDKENVTKIYTDLQVLFVKEQKYDDAMNVLQPRIDALLSTHEDIQRNKDLAQAYRDAAEVEQARKHWPQAIEDRTHVVQTLELMKSDAYPDQPTDLVYAYSFLSWAEIFGDRVDKGIPDAQNAISRSKQIDGQPYLYGAYENAIRALAATKHYDDEKKFLAEFTQTLLASPSSIDREREIATFVDIHELDLAQEANLLQRVVDFRRDEVSRLTALKPNAYSDLKADTVSAYGDLSFEEEKIGDFAQGVSDAKTALNLDKSQPWIEENEASGLLFSGHPEEARALYIKVKDQQWEGEPLSKAIGDDLLTFCKLGYTRPEMAALVTDLKLDNRDLNTCLKSPPKPAPSK